MCMCIDVNTIKKEIKEEKESKQRKRSIQRKKGEIYFLSIPNSILLGILISILIGILL